MPLLLGVRLDVRRRRPVRDPGPRRPRRPGRDRRDRRRRRSGSAIAYALFTLLRRSEGANPFSTVDLVGRDASSSVAIPAGRFGSVLVKAEGQTHEFSATASVDIPAGTHGPRDRDGRDRAHRRADRARRSRRRPARGRLDAGGEQAQADDGMG